MPCPIRISVQPTPFDTAAEIAAASQGRTDIGAVVCFTGLVRDMTGDLAALTLEHYPAMTEAEISRIAHEAANRFDLSYLCIIHRFGRLEPGDQIVLVVTAAPHRKAAFDAADYLMDYLKTRAPFWKKESRKSGDSNWVAAKHEDDQAAARWGAGENQQNSG